MTLSWAVLDAWPIRVVLLGGLLLLVGRLLMLATRQPARRVVIGTASAIAALLVVPLSLMPGWLPVVVGTAPSPEPPLTEVASLPADPVVGWEIPGPFVRVILPEADATATGAGIGRATAMAEASASGVVPVAPPTSAPHVPSEPPAAVAAEAEALPAPATRPTASMWAWVAVGYGAIGLLVLGRLAMGHVVLSRRWNRALLPGDGLAQVFRALAVDCPKSELRVSPDVPGPICFGVVRPRVLIPLALAVGGDTPTLRCLLAHELSHLRRRDPLVGWLIGLARPLFFVWPWLAGLRRDVRLAQEYLADADAAALAAAPADYAEMLVRISRSRPAPLGAAAAGGSSSELYRRVAMLLKPTGRVEGRCPRRWAMMIGGGLTAAAIVTAGLYVQPRVAAAAEDKKEEKADKPKDKAPAKPKDAIKDAIEKLKKDVGDPETAKMLDEMLKALENPRRVPPIPGIPGAPAAPGFPGAFPPGGLGGPNLEQMREMQAEMMKKMQEAMGRFGGQGGFAGGVVVGPDGMARPFGGMGFGSQGRLGVRVEKPSDALASQLDLPNGQGLVLIDVPANSPAGKAGMKPHDVLVEFGGKPVPNEAFDFAKQVRELKAGDKVDAVVLRKGKKEAVKGIVLPEVKEPEFGGVPGFPPARPGFGGPRVIPDGDEIPVPGAKGSGKVKVTAGPGESVRVEQVNDAFTVLYEKGGIKVTLSGMKDDGGQVKIESIEVVDGAKTTKAESIDKLPKDYQELAKSALKTIK